MAVVKSDKTGIRQRPQRDASGRQPSDHGHAARPANGAGGSALGRRERKKARLRQQIIDTAIGLFRKNGYENTRVDDIVQALEISQPTFFRYFPTKDAVLRDVALRGKQCVSDQIRSELASDASTSDRLHNLYGSLARQAESNRPLWRAVVLSGAMDPVRSPEMRRYDEVAVGLLREVLAQG